LDNKLQLTPDIFLQVFLTVAAALAGEANRSYCQDKLGTTFQIEFAGERSAVVFDGAQLPAKAQLQGDEISVTADRGDENIGIRLTADGPQHSLTGTMTFLPRGDFTIRSVGNSSRPIRCSPLMD